MTDARKALAARIEHAITTAQNDDLSEPMSDKRDRHVVRQDTMRDVLDYLRSPLPGTPEEVAREAITSALVVAWDKYVGAFGEPPHGTRKQMRALVQLIPDRALPPAPMPEPVAWRVDGTQCGQPAVFFYYKQNAMLQGHIDQGDKITPLYAAPMPERSQDQEALLEFFKWAMREGPWDGCDLDGAAVQNKAEALGLIIKTQYNAEKHGVQSDFETGDDWFEYAPHIKAPIPEREGMREALEAMLITELVEWMRLAADGRVSSEAIGIRVRNALPSYRAALAPHDKTEG